MYDTLLANLQTAIINYTNAIVEISANPRPNYSVEGQSFSMQEFMKSLLDSLKLLLEAYSNLQIIDVKTVANA